MKMLTTFYATPKQAKVRRDVVVFVSGYEDGSGTSGVAYPAGACRSDAGFVWVEKASPILLAHELAHTLGAGHDDSGIMKKRVMSTDPLIFSMISMRTVRNFVAQVAGPRCMSTAAPICDSSCPGRCLKGRCVASAPNSGRTDFVPCIPIAGMLRCVQRRIVGARRLSFVTECPNQFILARPPKGMIENAFCCERLTESRMTLVVPATTFVRNLNLRFSNGREGVLKGHVSNEQAVLEVELMKTRLLPGCKGKGIAAKRTASPTPLARPRSCMDTFSGHLGPVCITMKAGVLEGSKAPAVDVYVRQRRGRFFVVLRTEGNLKTVGTVLRVRRAATEDEVVMKEVSGTEATLEVAMVDVATVGSYDMCCGRKLYVAVAVRVCGKVGACVKRFKWLEVVIRCGDGCEGKAGRAVRMSWFDECPWCAL